MSRITIGYLVFLPCIFFISANLSAEGREEFVPPDGYHIVWIHHEGDARNPGHYDERLGVPQLPTRVTFSTEVQGQIFAILVIMQDSQFAVSNIKTGLIAISGPGKTVVVDLAARKVLLDVDTQFEVLNSHSVTYFIDEDKGRVLSLSKQGDSLQYLYDFNVDQVVEANIFPRNLVLFKGEPAYVEKESGSRGFVAIDLKTGLKADLPLSTEELSLVPSSNTGDRAFFLERTTKELLSLNLSTNDLEKCVKVSGEVYGILNIGKGAYILGIDKGGFVLFGGTVSERYVLYENKLFSLSDPKHRDDFPVIVD